MAASTDHDGTMGSGGDELQMAPDRMLDLAHRAAELLVERTDGLSAEDAWDGEFRDGLAPLLMGEPPEEGLPAEEVLERAAREILPYAARLDHPRSFGFVPTAPTWPGVLADFMAAGFNNQRGDLAYGKRPQPG